MQRDAKDSQEDAKAKAKANAKGVQRDAKEVCKGK